MKFVIIISSLAAVALAAPSYGSGGGGGGSSASTREQIAILRDDRQSDDYGRYSVNVETANGISLNDNGSPDGPKGAVIASGSFSYTSPEGIPVLVTYVADENGFQPQSDLLPVAPAFPHPIPQFVLDQIAFAAEQDARRGSSERSSSGSYTPPPPSRYN